MTSHHYQFTCADACRFAGLPLVPVALLAGILQVAAAFGWLPAPRPALDMDRTILVHQAQACRLPQSAEVLFMGDSSCLIDVSAPQLEKGLGLKVLNLGALSYLDLPAHASMLREFVLANPGRPRVVVLLLHPEALRLQETPRYYNESLRRLFDGREQCQTSDLNGRLDCWLGIESLRERLLPRLVPLPLPGAYGVRYGFTWDLWRFLTESQGGAVDPNRFDRQAASGNAEYRLAKRFELESRQFRAALPPGVRLVAGLTPAPASFVGPDHPATVQRLLQQWGGWLQADLLLTNLPASLPDDRFASVTHLNNLGAAEFSTRLTEELRAVCGAPPK